jgi:hypothetical protein
MAYPSVENRMRRVVRPFVCPSVTPLLLDSNANPLSANTQKKEEKEEDGHNSSVKIRNDRGSQTSTTEASKLR